MGSTINYIWYTKIPGASYEKLRRQERVAHNSSDTGHVQTVRGDTLAEQIARHLRRSILRGNLPPGSSLKERDNAAELGVSRTPMREAIRMLAKEGLVELRPSRSPVVVDLSPKEISDQVVVLLALEKLSAELACAEATDAELADLRAINDKMADAFDYVDALDLFEIDMSFHSAIARASHNPALSEAHHAFLARLWRARYLSARQRRNRQRVVNHHTSILEALEARDRMVVRAAIDTHLGNLADDITSALAIERSATS